MNKIVFIGLASLTLSMNATADTWVYVGGTKLFDVVYLNHSSLRDNGYTKNGWIAWFVHKKDFDYLVHKTQFNCSTETLRSQKRFFYKNGGIIYEDNESTPVYTPPPGSIGEHLVRTACSKTNDHIAEEDKVEANAPENLLHDTKIRLQRLIEKEKKAQKQNP